MGKYSYRLNRYRMDRVGVTNPVLYFVPVKNKSVTGKKEVGLLLRCPLNLQGQQ